MSSHRISRSIVSLTIVAFLAGCGHKNPKPDTKMRQDRAETVQQQITNDATVEPLQGPLTLSTAIARAIKYNLDHKVKQMETAVAQEHLNLARISYLPEITAMAGYSSRNNEAGAISRSLATGDVSLEYSTSQEKTHTLSSLRAAWDVVDFGLAYFIVAQKTNEIAIAKEERRKVLQNIIQDVQEAYWRAYIAQELTQNIDNIVHDSSASLSQFKNLSQSGKIDPKEGLAQQREILQIRYNMRSLQEQLAQGRIHLNALINLPPTTTYKLEPAEKQPMPNLSAMSTTLEKAALLNRPELRMEDSKLKITNDEIKKSMLDMLPRIQFYGQINNDTNEYLYNGTWNEAGIQVTWNLLKATSAYERKNNFKTETKLAEARHKALSMAVITQVHLALNRYSVAQSKYEDANELEKVSTSYADLLRRDTQREGESGFAKIRANLQATAAQMESMLAYAEVQNALIRVYNTLGIDPINEDALEAIPINDLASKVNRHFQDVSNTLVR